MNQLEEQEAIELVKSEPRNLKKVLVEITEKTGIKMSLKTLKRICKKAGISLQRIRKTLKQKKNERDYQESVEMIAQLIGHSAQGQIDLVYFEESSFYRKPSVPYAWQEKGRYIEVPCSHSQNLNVLGFINHDCQFQSDVFDKTINTDVVIACFDEFAKTIDKPTYVLIDNAPTHTSDLFLVRKH